MFAHHQIRNMGGTKIVQYRQLLAGDNTFLLNLLYLPLTTNPHRSIILPRKESMKNITFSPYTEYAQSFLDPPEPANRNIPDWYKKTSLLMPGNKTRGSDKNSPKTVNTTIKGCVPFLDSITSGYIFKATTDIEFRKENGEIRFTWFTPEHDTVTMHNPDQVYFMPEPYNGYSYPFKWGFQYIITTPPGYSTFFTHPINRHDLPFRTFSGVVDTDMYETAVQFPFQLLKFDSERIIIEKGTPLCQFIPFKRDNWKSEVKDISILEMKQRSVRYLEKIIKPYKARFWEKKQYK